MEFSTDSLAEKCNWVIDIGIASEMLSDVLKEYNFKNLNDVFPNENTTTEFMCRAIHRAMCNKVLELQKQKSSHKFDGALRIKL